MEQVLLVIHLLIAVALIVVVLLQRPASDGGGLMGGGSTMGGLFTARGSANVMTRTTAILATIFICTSLLLSYLASTAHSSRSLADTLVPNVAPEKVEPETAPKSETPAAPAVPEVPLSK